MRVINIKKVSLLCLCVLIALVTFKYFIYYYSPNLYKYGSWMIPLWWDKCQFNFSKHVVPQGYEFVTYREGPYGIIDSYEKGLVFYEKNEGKQAIVLFRLQESLNLDLSKIIINASEPRRTDRIERHSITDNLEIIYFLPFFQRHDFSATNQLSIKGFSSRNSIELETQKTKIKYFSGSFRQIGFYKGEKGLFRYPVPVFDFKQPRHGALAVINDKTTDKTLFAIGVVPANLPFNEEEFLTVVKSLTFDAEPFILPESLRKLPVVRTVK